MKTSTKSFLWGLSLSLSTPCAECFVICGGASGGSVRPRAGRCPSRPLRQPPHLSTAPRAASGTSPAFQLAVGVGGRGLFGRRAGVAGPGTSRLRQGIRLFTTQEEMEIGEEEEQEEQEEEEEYREYAFQNVEQQVLINPNDDPNVVAVSQKGPEEVEGGKEGGEFEVKSEWHACVGEHDFFGDLPPFAEWDPRVIPDNAAYSADELRGNVGCDHNPFDLTSFWMDRSIEMGHVDEEIKEAIEPMMKVVEQVCELIDTTDNVLSFKYTGLIQHRTGIEAWTKMLIKEHYPEVRDVKLVTNRTRDRRDH